MKVPVTYLAPDGSQVLFSQDDDGNVQVIAYGPGMKVVVPLSEPQVQDLAGLLQRWSA